MSNDNFWTDALVKEFCESRYNDLRYNLVGGINQFKASHADVKEKERDWEILTGMNESSGIHGWKDGPDNNGFDTCHNMKCAIHSVRRLSDNEVFTIGDRVGTDKTFFDRLIHSFEIAGNEMIAHFKNNGGFSNIGFLYKAPQETPKPVLFTTEDGVEVKDEHAGIYYIADFKIRTRKAKNTIHLTNKKFFYIKNAEKYLLFNKPCLSINEIFKLINECRGGTYIKEDKFTEELKAFAKEKINKS